MSSDGKDVASNLQAKEQRDLAPNLTSQVIGEMRSSLLFQYNWEDLLQCGPTAISCIGACFVAASSDKATVILTPPETGFQYLRYHLSIQANLVECANLGQSAFFEAVDKMGNIQGASEVMNQKINDILGILGDPISAKKLLRPQLDSIKSGASQCFWAARSMDKEFEKWLLYVYGMHAACAQQEVTTRASNQICLAVEQTRLDQQKETASEAKKEADLKGKQVELEADAFKKASDEFPAGCDLVGQQNKLAETQAKLANLTASSISLAEVKPILIECIKLTITLKGQVMNLVRFFKAMTTVIDICVRLHLEPLVETVEALVAADGNDPNDPYKELKIGDFTLTDPQRSLVYSATVTMRSYFSVFGDIAKMWMDLWKENVLPGLRLCDELSVTVEGPNAGAEMKKRLASLEKWSGEAAARVAKVASEKRAEIMDGMESRINEVKETTARIEPPAVG